MNPLTRLSTWWRTRHRPSTTPGEGSEDTVRLLLPERQPSTTVRLTPERELPSVPPAFKSIAPKRTPASAGPSRKAKPDPEKDMRARLRAAGIHPGGIAR